MFIRSRNEPSYDFDLNSENLFPDQSTEQCLNRVSIYEENVTIKNGMQMPLVIFIDKVT